MPLREGDRLGPYEVLVRLGAGEMGEVFRAQTTLPLYAVTNWASEQ